MKAWLDKLLDIGWKYFLFWIVSTIAYVIQLVLLIVMCFGLGVLAIGYGLIATYASIEIKGYDIANVDKANKKKKLRRIHQEWLSLIMECIAGFFMLHEEILINCGWKEDDDYCC